MSIAYDFYGNVIIDGNQNAGLSAEVASSITFDSGSISNGSHVTNSQRLRSAWIPKNVTSITADDGYSILVLAWNGSTYVGQLPNMGWSTDVDFGSIANLYPDYTYRLLVKKDDGTSITISEKSNIHFYISTADKAVYDSRKETGLDSANTRLENYALQYAVDNDYEIDGVAKPFANIKKHLFEKNLCTQRGALSMQNYKLVDSNGTPITLRGVALFHIPEKTDAYHTYETLSMLRYYGVNMVRLPAYLATKKYYNDVYVCRGWATASDEIKADFDRIIGWCVELGLYVLIDFHVLRENGVASNWSATGKEFFTYFSDKYADVDNVLYEIANEPYSSTHEDANFITYISECRSIIRANNQTAPIICGIGQYLGSALYSALVSNGISDVFVSEHYYGNNLNDNTPDTYATNDVPLFCTEFGDSASDGVSWSDAYDGYTRKLMSKFETNGQSYSAWSWTSGMVGTPATALLKYSAENSVGYYSKGFLSCDLSHQGEVIFGEMTKYAFS